jgi:hypothetical protein
MHLLRFCVPHQPRSCKITATLLGGMLLYVYGPNVCYDDDPALYILFASSSPVPNAIAFRLFLWPFCCGGLNFLTHSSLPANIFSLKNPVPVSALRFRLYKSQQFNTTRDERDNGARIQRRVFITSSLQKFSTCSVLTDARGTSPAPPAGK